MNFGSQDKMWKTNKKTLKTTSPISHRSMEVYKFYLTISHLKHGKLILKKNSSHLKNITCKVVTIK